MKANYKSSRKFTFVSLWEVTCPWGEVSTITQNRTVTLCLPVVCTAWQLSCVAMVSPLPKIARGCDKLGSLIAPPVKAICHTIISLVPSTIFQQRQCHFWDHRFSIHGTRHNLIHQQPLFPVRTWAQSKVVIKIQTLSETWEQQYEILKKIEPATNFF